MNVILWAVVGLAVLVLLIAVSTTCSAFSTYKCEAVFDKITFVLVHMLGIASAATGFAVLLILMMERGGA